MYSRKAITKSNSKVRLALILGINGNNLISGLVNNNKNNMIPFATGISIIIIIIIDLLMTRQLLHYDSVSGNIMFICTIVVGYAVGSFILLRFAQNVSKDLRKKIPC